MRVGFWRLFECMKKFNITPTLAINGIVCKTYPRVAQAAKDAGWEFMGHGWIQTPMHKVEDQKKAIGDTIAAIRDVTGKPPKGWESPGLTETADTIDHLAEAGIEYVANWVLDDQPVWIDAAPRKVVSVPYSLEINDIAMMVIQNHTASELLVRGRHYFDRLYEESAKTTRVMAIAVHPYLTGTPHRIHYLEELYTHILDKPGVVHWTGGEGQTGVYMSTFRALEAYDPAANRWTILPNMPVSRHGLAGAVVGNRLHMVSGDVQSAGTGVHVHSESHDAFEIEAAR